MIVEVVVHFGYDARTKTWFEIRVDSSGGWVTLTGKGPPDRIELTGKAVGPRHEMTVQKTLMLRSDAEFAVASTGGRPGARLSLESVCRK